MTSELRTNWLLKHLANETQKEYIVSIGNEQKIGYKGKLKIIRNRFLQVGKKKLNLKSEVTSY